MKNGIVINCYNEGSSINFSAIEKFIDSNPNYVFCFVNNGSNDNTLEVLKSFQRRLLNSHNSLSTQLLICNLSKTVNSNEAINLGKDHLLVNTLVKNIMVADNKFFDKNMELSLLQSTANAVAA